ncbi:nitrogen regulation protein NR(II) [Alkalilimnicola ehrlichii MLHE-1]|uniref:Sensory histidine kinase/phosphatase NtrB n=1 Tax=Alkalilimnicola ehrlichii (strain ATCC BAA-1101 / DSM 17681 / MLHE-1) TaxID=187272 RepID=Q0ACR3_ALKEH|nr:nitrogen regulation protein NR(II) [Alkalilimnicola ehrlichii]ABI55374.1 signal transduction histidine kinase, nitrogen specific, NtrB [Alkalilimnicola ehrlichii MLHE-1]
METHTPPYVDLLEHITTAVVMMDTDTRVLHLNPAAEMLFRVSLRQVSGQPLLAFAPSAELLDTLVRDVVETGRTYTQRERRLPVSQNHLITVDCTVTPMPNGRVLLELAEIDRHLRITREHHLVAQNRAIRELIRGLAHEIKNPLGGLRGAAQLLERELAGEELREYTQVIINEADRLQNLVDSLLGPNAVPRREPVNIHQVLERVRQLVVAEAPAGVQLERDYDPSIPPVTAQFDHLVQACLNLVRNALQAVAGEGTITLRTRTQRQFTIAGRNHKLVARIDVVDDGPGIPAEQLEQIFYPMVTTRPEGSGLGLPIAQTLVGQHSGLVECSSEPGHTVFTIWLPLETTP